MQAVDIRLLHHHCPNGSHRLFPRFHSNKPPLYLQTHSCHPGVSLSLVKKKYKIKSCKILYCSVNVSHTKDSEPHFPFVLCVTFFVLFEWAASKKHSGTSSILIQWYKKGGNIFYMRKAFSFLYWNYITFLILLMLQLKDLTKKKKKMYRLHIIT